MEKQVKVAWVDASATGFEMSTATISESSFSVDGRISGPDATPFTVDYCVSCDDEWRTRYVFVAESGGRRLELVSTGRGRWTSGDGNELSHIRGALDVDISATPLTNTLPIRRLDLTLGETADVTVALVSVPELEVTASTQRYTRIGPRTYRFELLDSEFTRDLTVDAEGLVLEYPGLFSRRSSYAS